MVYHEVQDDWRSHRHREYFFVTNDKVGSKIKIISFKEKASQNSPFQTKYVENSSRIVSLIKRGDKLFVLTDDFLIKTLKIKVKEG
jgi:hypothetical protein